MTPWNITAPALNTARPSYGVSSRAAFSTTLAVLRRPARLRGRTAGSAASSHRGAGHPERGRGRCGPEPGPVGPSGADPEEGGLGADGGGAFGEGERLHLGAPAAHSGRCRRTGPPCSRHGLEHHPGIGQRCLFGRGRRRSRSSWARCRSGPRSRSSISRRDAAKNNARADSSPSRSRARICRWMAWRSSASQATCSPHRCACSRASGSRTWAATSSSRAARDRRTSSSSGPQCAASAASRQSATSSGAPTRLRTLHRLVGELAARPACPA